MAITLNDSDRAFLEKPLFGTLATVGAKGIPYQVLVWYILQADEIVISTPAASYKVGNIRSQPYVSLSISEGPRFITVRGRATIDDNSPNRLEVYHQIATRYLGAEGAEQWWLAQSARPGYANRVTLRFPIEHIISVRS
jgi:PPOX class probable F420-dependent enzyme